MKLVIRLVILVVAMSGLVYGFAWETRTVGSIGFEPTPPAEIDGLGFVEGATTDAYILRDGELFDAYSLKPEFAQVKDCKT